MSWSFAHFHVAGFGRLKVNISLLLQLGQYRRDIVKKKPQNEKSNPRR